MKNTEGDMLFESFCSTPIRCALQQNTAVPPRSCDVMLTATSTNQNYRNPQKASVGEKQVFFLRGLFLSP